MINTTTTAYVDSSSTSQSTDSMENGTIVGICISAGFSLLAIVFAVMLVIVIIRKRRLHRQLLQQQQQLLVLNAILPPELQIQLPIPVGVLVNQPTTPHHLSVTRVPAEDCETPKSIQYRDGSRVGIRRNSVVVEVLPPQTPVAAAAAVNDQINQNPAGAAAVTVVG